MCALIVVPLFGRYALHVADLGILITRYLLICLLPSFPRSLCIEHVTRQHIGLATYVTCCIIQGVQHFMRTVLVLLPQPIHRYREYVTCEGF